MTHLAIDLALGTSGFCWGPRRVDCCTFRCPIPPSQPMGARLSWWRRRVSDLLDAHKEPAITRIVVEAPLSYGQHPDTTIRLGKLHGAIEVRAHGARLPYDDSIKPSTLKKWATGNGHASKAQMMAAARGRFGWEGTDDNEADAVLLWFYVDELRERGVA